MLSPEFKRRYETDSMRSAMQRQDRLDEIAAKRNAARLEEYRWRWYTSPGAVVGVVVAGMGLGQLVTASLLRWVF